MKPLTTMRAALADKAVLADAMIGPSWAAWRALLIAACGERLTASERKVFKRLTQREREPGCMVDVLLIVSGRRSGKSRAAAVLSTYLSTCIDWSDCLSLGETGASLFLAPTERQAGYAHHYVSTFLNHVPLLKTQIASETNDNIALSNGIEVRTEAASWRHSRGMTAISVVLDECAFFRNDDSANSDTELMTALRPSLATTQGMMILTSSPSTMEGVVYKLWRRHFGAQGDKRILIVQTATRVLNPSLRQDVVDRAFEEDATGAASEFGGEFRMPVSNYLDRSLVEQSVFKGLTRKGPLPGVRYFAHVDVAGGSGTDSFTMAIGHKQVHLRREICVFDALFEARPKFNPDEIVAQCAELLRVYGITTVFADAYAGDWPKTAFARHGITVLKCPLVSSELYLHALPAWTASRVQMLDNERAVDQLSGLKRKPGQTGREVVTHVRGGHDDLALVICGAIWQMTPAQAAIPMVGMSLFDSKSGRDLLADNSAPANGQLSVHGAGAPLADHSNQPWRDYGRGVGTRFYGDHPGW